MYRLSIVVPLIGGTQRFEDTLVSLLQNRPADCEVLVVHRGAYEDPYDLRGEVDFVPVGATTDWIGSLNAGIRAARGEVLHLVQPGIQAAEGWADIALEHFCNPEISAVAPLVLDAADENRIVAAGLRYTSAGSRVVHAAGWRLDTAKRLQRRAVAGPSLMAAFYRRSVVTALEGLCPRAGSWADIDLALSMHRLGFRTALEIGSVMTTLDADFASPLSFGTGRSAERVFWRHNREFGGNWALPVHAAHVLGSLLFRPLHAAAYSHAIGRVMAALERSSYREFDRRLQRAGEACHRSEPTSDEDDDEHCILPWPGESRRRVA